MTPNELLLWLSARKEGSWPQFRAAVEKLELEDQANEAESDAALPIHLRICFNLERLGHVEFGAKGCEDGWRIVPPTLALSHHHGKVTGVLCGARTPKLIAKLQGACGPLAIEQTPKPDCPDILRINAPDAKALLQLAAASGLLCQVDAPSMLLSHLPSLKRISGWRSEPLPNSGRDWDVKHFVIKGKIAQWLPITIREANADDSQGLFRFTKFQVPSYFLRVGNLTVQLPGQVGKYFVLSQKKRRVLKYSKHQKTLSVPAIFRPPLLTERALILCSGFPPAFSLVRERPTLEYSEVPEEIAGMTAEVLEQDFI